MKLATYKILTAKGYSNRATRHKAEAIAKKEKRVAYRKAKTKAKS